MRSDTSNGETKLLIGEHQTKPFKSRKLSSKLIVAAFLLLIGAGIAYFTLYHPGQASAVGVNRQYAVEEFPESNDVDLSSDYGSSTVKTKGGKKGGKKDKAPKPSKAPKTKPSKAPKVKPTKAPKVKKTKPAKVPKTLDPTTAKPTTSKPTTSWPTERPTPKPTVKVTAKPTTSWPTEKPKPINAPGMTCADGAKGVLSTGGVLDDFKIGLDVDCDAETVTVSITKSSFSNTWFGIVFSDQMIGTSLIYTMGNPGAKEKDRTLALYQYDNNAKSSRKVVWDSSVEWKEETVIVNDDTITVVYTAPIDGSPLFLDTKEVNIRWAFGPNDYNIEYHTGSGRSNDVLTLNLVGQ